MKAVYDLEFPYDVAVIQSANNSCYLVLLFTNTEKCEYFYSVLIHNHTCDLKINVEDNGKHTFIFSSSNSPQNIIIKSNRDLDNNILLNMLLDEDYKDYSYLTCGYKNEQQVFHLQDVAYPLILSYS